MNQDKDLPIPNSKETEMMILGSMLTDINALNTASDILEDHDFDLNIHRIIFQVLKNLYKNDKSADVHLVSEELKKQDKLKVIGGAKYLTDLAQYAGTSAHIEAYVKDLRDLRCNREFLFLGLDIAQKASKKTDPSQLFLEFEERVRQMSNRRFINDKFMIKNIQELGVDWFDKDPPPKKMLLEYSDDKGHTKGFIPKGNVCMLVGMGGIGKSHWVAQLSIAICTNTLFLDFISPTVYSEGGVFLGLAENDLEDIHRLVSKSSKRLLTQLEEKKENLKHNLKHRLFPFSFQGHQCQFIHDGAPTPYFYELKRALINNAPGEGWSLVILDPISRFLGSEAETDNASATAFIALIEQLAIDLPGNPTILFCHHMNKSAINGNAGGQDAARGSSAITDGVRLQINLRKTNENDKKNNQNAPIANLDSLTVMTISKSNFTAIMGDVYLEKDTDGHLTNRNSRKIPIGKRKS